MNHHLFRNAAKGIRSKVALLPPQRAIEEQCNSSAGHPIVTAKIKPAARRFKGRAYPAS